VHTPSAVPSWSHADPSTQVVLGPVMPLHVTMQSVADGPPPAKQSGPGHAAGAIRAMSSEASAITEPRRMKSSRGGNIPEGPAGFNGGPGRSAVSGGSAAETGGSPTAWLRGDSALDEVRARARQTARRGRRRPRPVVPSLASVELVHVCCLKPLGPLRHLE